MAETRKYLDSFWTINWTGKLTLIHFTGDGRVSSLKGKEVSDLWVNSVDLRVGNLKVWCLLLAVLRNRSLIPKVCVRESHV